ncbi:MAG: F0F1 ATP synthase subunit gamma [Actinobacteria bacterium]|jgi:F-type H+-transporting ATPase subunit gamma|nr:F0F1 ATP synthase subunit gamma [Actinomycetota bacterium]
MGAQIREYRQRIRSVSATKKITRAMELMAASRVVKAQQAVRESTPYARALTKAVSAVATFSDEDHPLTSEKQEVAQAAVLIIAADRGLAGGYNANVLKESERLIARLVEEEGKEVRAYLVGRRAVNFYTFRKRDFVAQWTGFTEKPSFEHAREIGERLVADFTDPDPASIDEVHVVYTRFVSMVTQEPQVIRLLPLEVVEGTEKPAAEDLLPMYEFEPDAVSVLDALLPKYVNARLFNCLLQSAASELAARQRAMKSATDNAEELIKKYTRLANQARQAEITQEISEIVGGASALAESK